MALTKEQKDFILKQLNSQYSSVKFKCDEHEVSLSLERIDTLKLAICVYVDGISKSIWLHKPEEHKQSKFYPTRYKSYYSAKKRAELIKTFGKRWVKEHFDIDAKFEYKLPFFNTAKSALSHLIKVSNDIELITEVKIESTFA
ncbi:TPA: hypothetical protein MW296_000131 [Acinetobacter baumannii]|nr:hypothetical protein [Acinetobacter baumannii]